MSTESSSILVESMQTSPPHEQGIHQHAQPLTASSTSSGLQHTAQSTTPANENDTNNAANKINEKAQSFDYVASSQSENSLKHSNTSTKTVAAQPSQPANYERWETGLSRHLPWLALVALVGGTCAIIASAAILALADGTAVTSWKYAPTVYLAILSTLTNLCLTTALDQGAVLSWWRHALHGTTVKDLSQIWSYGTSLKSALVAWKDVYRFSVHRLAIAKIFILVVLIDGPLLQRALTIVSSEKQSTVSMEALVAPQVPQRYTSSLGGRTFQYTPTASYTTVMREYSQQTVMRSPFNTTCNGNCSATILAAGLSASNCTETSAPFSYSEQNANTNRWLSFFASTNLGVDSDTDYAEKLVLNIGGPVLGDGSCTGHFITTICFLESAIARYPVELSSDSKSISFQPSANLSHPEIVRLSNNTANNPVPGTTLSGLVATSNERFNGSFTWLLDRIYDWQPENANLFTMQYLPQYNASTGCPGSYRNPKNDILAAYNEILFRLSLQAAQTNVNLTEFPLDQGQSLKQAVQVTSHETVNTYEVVKWAMSIAVAVMALGIAAVLWTLWGWWEIGTQVSLDPIGMAKAFSAPILAAYQSTGSFKDETRAESGVLLLKLSAFWQRITGRKAAQHTTALAQSNPKTTIRVVYGAIETEEDPNGPGRGPQIKKPLTSSSDINKVYHAEGPRLRMGFGQPGIVYPLRRGECYIR